jgi:hypothetical protein
MRSRMKWGRVVGGFGLLIATGLFVLAQYVPSPRVQYPSRSGFGNGPDLDPVTEAKRMRALNADRHKSVVSDTEKLVKLARQLDAEVASNATDGLTAEEVQKLAAIEKLAHNVKSKMAQSFGGGPEFRPPLIETRPPGTP